MKSRSTFAVGFVSLALLVGGCAGPELPALTPLTTLDVTGEKPFEYLAPADGFVSVFDVNEDQSIFNGSIKKDQVLKIDPTEQELYIGKKVAPGVQVPRGNKLEIIFRATASAS